MSDFIELFEPQGFIPNHLRPPNITLKPRKAKRINKEAVAVYQSAKKRLATESVETVSANRTIRLSKEFNPSHRLSMRLDDGRRPSSVSPRLNDGLPTNKKSFASLKERLQL